jgi:3-oxoacyl-[acyl-carrier-protein] synthase-3
MKNAGFISFGGYLPGKKVNENYKRNLCEFLRENTTLYPEYISEIEKKSVLPGYIETNADGWEDQPWFECWLNSLPEKQRLDPFLGAKERRRVPLDPISVRSSLHPIPMLSSDAETLAAALALFNAKIAKQAIDLILVSSLYPDFHIPQNASLVQHKLGILNAGAYNIDTCCSSFVTMSEIAMTYVRAGLKKKVLLVCSSLDSMLMDKSSYFGVRTGDAAMAAIVGEVEEGYGYITSDASSHGNRHSAIMLHKREPELLMQPKQRGHFIQEFVSFYNQDLCKEIARNAASDMLEVVSKALEKKAMTIQNIDFLITHQPVNWAAKAWSDALGMNNKFYQSYETNGNIACCSVPANHLEAIEKGLVKGHDTVLICSSGVGENHIALVHKVSPVLIENSR